MDDTHEAEQRMPDAVAQSAANAVSPNRLSYARGKAAATAMGAKIGSMVGDDWCGCAESECDKLCWLAKALEGSCGIYEIASYVSMTAGLIGGLGPNLEEQPAFTRTLRELLANNKKFRIVCEELPS